MAVGACELAARNAHAEKIPIRDFLDADMDGVSLYLEKNFENVKLEYTRLRISADIHAILGMWNFWGKISSEVCRSRLIRIGSC